MCHWLFVWVGLYVANDRNTSVFESSKQSRTNLSILFDCLVFGDEGAAILRNFGSHSPNETRV